MILVKYLMMCFYLHNNECLSILIVMGFKLFCASSFRRNFLIRYEGSWVVYKGGYIKGVGVIAWKCPPLAS